MDTDLVEESMDSIPRPEYEAIEGDDDSMESSNSNANNTFINEAATTTSIAVHQQQQLKESLLVQKATASDNCAEKPNASTIEDDAVQKDCDNNEEVELYDADEEEEEEDDEEEVADQEMHATSLRYVYDGEEERQLSEDPLKIRKGAPKETKLEAETRSEKEIKSESEIKIAKTTKNTKMIIHYGGTVATVSVGASTPKILPAKIRNNKLVMVQMIDECGKTISPPLAANRAEISEKATATATPTVGNDKMATTQQARITTLRSITPLSREFLALQRSVNESKILSEFVTDTAAAAATEVSASSSRSAVASTSSKSARKLRKSGATTATQVPAPPAKDAIVGIDDDKKRRSQSTEKGGELRRRKSEAAHVTADNSFSPAAAATSTPGSAEKTRKPSKFAPLKDEFSVSAAELAKLNPGQRCRSRSKSVQRKSSSGAGGGGTLDNSYPSNASTTTKLMKWPSDEKITLKRTNMRSQNSEFVQKQVEFLNRVIHQQDRLQQQDEYLEERGTAASADGDTEERKHFLDASVAEEHDFSVGAHDSVNLGNESTVAGGGSSSSLLCSFGDNSMLQQSKLSLPGGDSSFTEEGDVDDGSLEAHMKLIWQPSPKRGWDSFCWKCRECADLIPCSKCVRCFHTTCIKITATTKLDDTWICPECTATENVLNGPKRMRRNDISLDMLSQLLSFALKRMKNVKGYSKSLFSQEHALNQSKYIVNSITFSTLHEKIEKKVFRCAEEFVNETKWMLHNALIMGMGTTHNSKEVLTAKAIMKICRQEANEIDTCPECYLNANTRTDWFIDVCAQPHLLLWAKLKGFPYWPAKAMGPGQGAVNVRFFGEHDRAFVPVKDCFLYSVQDPNTQTGKRSARELADCIKEVELHIEKIKSKVGDFRHAAYRTSYDPVVELQQLEQMMPGVGEYMKRGTPKPSLQYKIVKTADNHLSIIKKAATTVTTEVASDSDHACPSKKRTDSGEVSAAPVESIRGTKLGGVNTKYEVIMKASNSDESNCSKVSTVILKRKSDSSTGGNVTGPSGGGGGSEIELPLPKMTKIEEKGEQTQHMLRTVADDCDIATTSSSSAKRKHDAESTASAVPNKETTAESEKLPRSKHAKHDAPAPPISSPRVPAITIKTNGIKAAAPPAKDAKDEGETPPPSSDTTAQNAMQQLVKHKQGVTIKKIIKDGQSGAQKSGGDAKTESLPATAVSATETAEPANTTTKSSEKAKQAQTVTNILKDLVPFVEVKKEPTSDDDDKEASAVSAEPDKSPNAPLMAKTNAVVIAATSGATVTPNIKTTMQGEQVAVVTATVVEPLVPPSPVMPQPQLSPTNETQLLATVVKQEVLSEDEEVAVVLQRHNSNAVATVDKAFAAPAAPPTSDAIVRVVGDTTIQRISTKQSNGSQTQTAAAVAACPTTSGKRVGNRGGPPFGPLPANVAVTSVTRNVVRSSNAGANSPPNSGASTALVSLSAAQQQLLPQQLRQVHRARKSFPNRSPPDVSPVRYSAATSTVYAAPTTVAPTQSLNVLTASIAADLKRSLLKTTSMVSIPIHDIVGGAATNNCRSSIPVPPLTAVSKTTPTITNAITTLAAVAAAATTTAATTTFVNCNGGGVSSASVIMSAPPPLAGLSQTPPSNAAVVATAPSQPLPQQQMSSLNHSSNGLSDESSPPPSQPLLSSQPAATLDDHLLGDFVTPTLASAITEVICRGPPKMSVRPNGPLQSEGSAMFPSQAGPVCRTLVENAHKLTDFFISVMEDTMCEMSVGDDSVLQAKITLLTLEVERTKQAYEHEISELKRTSDLMLCEMRKSMENEKTRVANEVRKQCELERLRSIEDTKKKQWCANCGREAQFYCCWNTSYCDYPCQQLHWSRHAASCAQTRPAASNEAASLTTTTATATTALNSSTATAAGSQAERQHINKSTILNATSNNSNSSTAATTSTAHYNKTVISHKKDKSGGGSNKSSTISALSTPAASVGTEVLKLPTNTYLRAVPPGGGSSNPRSSSSYPMQMPVQRFNIPLPIAAPVNTGGPPYTIVQRGTSWQLMSTATSSSNATTPTVAAPLATVTTAQQQTRLVSSAPSTKNNNGVGSRQRATGAAVSTSSHHGANVLRGTPM